jgi:hypothetical protein
MTMIRQQEAGQVFTAAGRGEGAALAQSWSLMNDHPERADDPIMRHELSPQHPPRSGTSSQPGEKLSDSL